MGTIWQPSLSQDHGPKYKAVAASIRDGVKDGMLAVGDQLPPVRDLAWQLKITPGTVARAYSILTDEGLLTAGVGRGTFVAAPKRVPEDDVWSHTNPLPESDAVNLLSPRMPDQGQVKLIRAALHQIADGPSQGMLNYPTRDAYKGAREAVVDWLSDVPLGPLTEQDIILAHGGQSAITLVLQTVLSGPKPVMLVEDLSYAGFRRAAELARAEVVGVEMDDHGVIPDALDAAARASGAQIFCTTPEVQNPTGGFTPLWRREELVRVAERNGLEILEDDCYRNGNPRAASYRVLAPQHAWHVSSISKSLTPALRIGFAIAPTHRSADLRRVSEYGFFGVAQPLAELTRIVLSDPRTREAAQRVREKIGEYVEVAVNILGSYDLKWDRDVPFLWLTLPSGWRSAAFCRAAEQQGVQIKSADEFALRDGRAPHAVRIAVNGHIGLQSFEAAMQRLRRLLDSPPEQISV